MAPKTKAMILILVVLTPTDSAAISSSRTERVETTNWTTQEVQGCNGCNHDKEVNHLPSCKVWNSQDTCRTICKASAIDDKDTDNFRNT